MCTPFGGKLFLKQVSVEFNYLISKLANTNTYLISYVFDLAEVTFCKKRQRKSTTKCNTLTIDFSYSSQMVAMKTGMS